VLDFGIARLAGGDEKAITFETREGQLVGTLAFMSPEQVRGGQSSIDQRCDVYALRVILYELLTGRLPIDVREYPLVEAARQIQEEEPVRLSQVEPAMRGDLEIFVSTALEKDRNRLYPFAGALGAELNRVTTAFMARTAVEPFWPLRIWHRPCLSTNSFPCSRMR
jgi:serine/threonine protein kinase